MNQCGKCTIRFESIYRITVRLVRFTFGTRNDQIICHSIRVWQFCLVNYYPHQFVWPQRTNARLRVCVFTTIRTHSLAPTQPHEFVRSLCRFCRCVPVTRLHSMALFCRLYDIRSHVCMCLCFILDVK